jgi:hypothetical protein
LFGIETIALLKCARWNTVTCIISACLRRQTLNRWVKCFFVALQFLRRQRSSKPGMVNPWPAKRFCGHANVITIIYYIVYNIIGPIT